MRACQQLGAAAGFTVRNRRPLPGGLRGQYALARSWHPPALSLSWSCGKVGESARVQGVRME